jgi:hypothetical protein
MVPSLLVGQHQLVSTGFHVERYSNSKMDALTIFHSMILPNTLLKPSLVTYALPSAVVVHTAHRPWWMRHFSEHKM